MKNSRFVFVVFLFSSAIFAQVNFKTGIIGGLSIYKYSEKRIDDWYDYKNKNGLVAGVVLDIGILNILSIEPSIVYSMRGAYHESVRQDYPGPGDNYTYKYWFTFNYIAIPIHAKFKYPSLPILTPYAFVGLNSGILLSAKKKTEEIGWNAPPILEEDIKQYQNTIDIGFDLGAGIEMNISKITPFIEYVYYLGVTSIANNGTAKNKGMEIKAGIKFAL